MPKTSRSEQMDFRGLEIIADEFTGSFNGEITGSVDWSNIENVPGALTSAQDAGTPSIRAIGTTATTAKAGDYTPAWDEVTNKPAVIAAGADAAAARTAIGAGTSNLTIGTTASTAAAGNHTHTATAVTATAISPGTATNVQGILAELAARITALENA